jgi:drug/metabolite transporter (DMT)-like permease
MVRNQSLSLSPKQQQESPWRYMFRTIVLITCALTVAGGSWYVAVDLTTASDLTAIYNCSAFFAYAFSIPLLRERVRISKVAAVGIAIAGVMIVAYGGEASAKHGGKSGGGAGGPDHEPEVNNRFLGNVIIGVGSVLYGLYEVLYKKVACPPDDTSPGRGMIFANAVGSMIGAFTFTFLWIPLPILNWLGWETFELPRGKQASMLVISVLANAGKSRLQPCPFLRPFVLTPE